MSKKRDTIYALSTPPGKSAIAVIRISGNTAFRLVNKMSSSMSKIPNKAVYNLLKTTKGDVIDQTITTYYKSPKSFTGEDMVEISMHGGNAVINKFINSFKKNKNVRLAEPGEFTRRSFENNKLDLTQVEAIADLVNAETEIQRKYAYNQLKGGFSLKTKHIYNELKKVLANIEAIIDFTDEDLPENLINKIEEQTKNINNEISQILNNYKSGSKIRTGYIVAIIGKSNTGKSSFFNNISKQDIAIVTNQPGTTRDALESFIDVFGLPVRFFDTAGIRNSSDLIENIGINKSIKISQDADINLVFIDKYSDIKGFRDYQNKIYIHSKYDLYKKPLNKPNVINISSKTSYGIKKLLKIIFKKLSNKHISENLYISRERHKSCLLNAKKFIIKSNKHKNYDIFAEDIRLAINEISKIYGSVDIEDILDIIFNDFCIGK